MLSLPRCSRSSALASFVICSWVFLILGLLSYFSSHALIPRSIFSEAFDTAIETFEATNVTALIWRIQHPGSDTTGLAGDDALLESLDSGEGDETESDGENEDADSTGDDTAADSGEGDADHAAQPDQPAQIDSQITRDLQPWAERGIRLYDLWATKHNFSSYTPRWEPLANEGRVVYSQAFDSSGLVRRKQRPKRVDLTAGLRKRLEVLAREREEKEAAGAREQEDDGEEDESDSKDESGTSKKRRLGSRKGKNSKSTKKSKGKDSNSTAPAGSSISSGASEEVEEEERWGGLGANMYEGVEDLDGRPIGLFEMWVVDGVPYMDATDVASAFATFYFGMLLKIHATLWAMRTSVVYRHKRGIQASPDQGEAYRASLGVNTTKEAAEFTAGIVPDTYLLVNIDPFPVLARRAQARPPGTGAVAEAVAPAPRPMAPVLSLCKTDADMDVLYPNPYFVSPTKWGAQVTRMRAVNRAHPWRTRKDTVWWRGSAGNHWPGSAPRIFTVSRWRNAKWSDFAFTDRYASSYYAWRKRWRRSVFRARIPKQSVKIRSGPEHAMPMERVGEYQYALHLPGFYAGTYSRMLQFLLWSGTVVFKVRPPEQNRGINRLLW